MLISQIYLALTSTSGKLFNNLSSPLHQELYIEKQDAQWLKETRRTQNLSWSVCAYVRSHSGQIARAEGINWFKLAATQLLVNHHNDAR